MWTLHTPESLHITNTYTTNLIFEAIKKKYVYTDQAGRFPITSRNGNKYVWLMYDYNANLILTDTLNNCTGQEIMRAYSKLHS